MVMSEKSLTAYLEEVMEEEEYWDDDGDPDDEHDVRSVLLFNTWPDENDGPKGVLPDRTVHDIPDGIVVEDDDGRQSILGRVEDTFRHWQQMKCNPREEWREVALSHSDDETEIANVRVPLMGTRARRGFISNSAEMQGPVEREDFYEKSKVTLVKLNCAD